MPMDIEKKRERDRRYREKKKEMNKAAWDEERREISKRAYAKKKAAITSRGIRQQRKVWREQKRKQKENRRGNAEIEIGTNTPKRSQAAALREKTKRQSLVVQLRQENASLRRALWREQKRRSVEKKRAASGSANELSFSTGQIVSTKSLRPSIRSEGRRVAQLLQTHGTVLQCIKNQKHDASVRTLIKRICRSYSVGSRRCILSKLGVDPRTLRTPDGKTRQWKTRLNIYSDVHAFYCRDDNSRLTAGKKETVTKNGKKEQLRYLNFTIAVLFEKFQSENPGIAISKAQFYRLRPFFVRNPRLSDRRQCLCMTCTNTQLFADGLYGQCLVLSRDLTHLMSGTFCSAEDPNCLQSRCELCSNKPVCTQPVLDASREVRIFQWRTEASDSGFMSTKCIQDTCLLEDARNAFEAMFRKYAAHFFRLRHQLSEARKIRENLCEGQILIHVDFSENYTCKFGEEVQSSHFGAHTQIVIHQGVLYAHGTEPQAFASVSSDTRKAASAVMAHLHPVLNYAHEVLSKVQKVSILTDSPSGQYRNKNLMYLFGLEMQSRGYNWEWIFTEAGHGKGAADGVGAALKRMCDRAVASGRSITSTKDFMSVQKPAEDGGRVLLFDVSAAAIEAIQTALAAASVPDMTGIRKAHHVFSDVAGQPVKFRQLACHCSGSAGSCNCWSTQEWHAFRPMLTMATGEKEPEALLPMLPSAQLEAGSFVAVMYDLSTGPTWFLGQVKSVNGSMASIQFMKRVASSNRFLWPTSTDCDEVVMTTVLHICMNPPELCAATSSTRQCIYQLGAQDLTAIEAAFSKELNR